MPPKESAKERKDREKAEAHAAMLLQQRQDFDVDEEKARQHQEMIERLDRAELGVEYFQRMIDPQSRIVVRRTEFDEMRSNLQRDLVLSSQRIFDLQEMHSAIKVAHVELQQELVYLRVECKSLAANLHRSAQQSQEQVMAEVSQCIARIEQQILHHRQDTSESGQLLNAALEKARLAAIENANVALATAHKISSLMQQHHPVHSRIPRRIKLALEALEKDELLMILDTLSFEDSVLQYLLYRYPPGLDDPFERSY
jgi:hypothetical protein